MTGASSISPSSVSWRLASGSPSITGATGVGKTFVACAQHALRRRYRAIYRRTSRLFDELALARADGTYARLLVRLARVDVLILDDWGMSVPSLCCVCGEVVYMPAPRRHGAAGLADRHRHQSAGLRDVGTVLRRHHLATTTTTALAPPGFMPIINGPRHI